MGHSPLSSFATAGVSGEDVKETLTAARDVLAEVLKIVEKVGRVDGSHHKQWALDQIVRAVTGDGYDQWVKDYCAGEDGPQTYEWDVGIAP